MRHRPTFPSHSWVDATNEDLWYYRSHLRTLKHLRYRAQTAQSALKSENEQSQRNLRRLQPDYKYKVGNTYLPSMSAKRVSDATE